MNFSLAANATSPFSPGFVAPEARLQRDKHGEKVKWGATSQPLNNRPTASAYTRAPNTISASLVFSVQ